MTTTEESGPYRLFNRDLDPHEFGSITELYGSIPYLTTHDVTHDSGLAWMNSADTWVEVLDSQNKEQDGTYVNFLSEGGAIEFFAFAS